MNFVRKSLNSLVKLQQMFRIAEIELGMENTIGITLETGVGVQSAILHVCLNKLYAMTLSSSTNTTVNTGKIQSYMNTSSQRMNNLMHTITDMHDTILRLTTALGQEDILNHQTQQAILSLIPTLFTK